MNGYFCSVVSLFDPIIIVKSGSWNLENMELYMLLNTLELEFLI